MTCDLVASETDPVLSLGAAVLTRPEDVYTRGGEGLNGIQVRTPGERVHHIQS